MKGAEKTRQQSRSRIVNAQPKPKNHNARCNVEHALQEDHHVIVSTKPVYDSNELGIERCRATGQFGESVLDELMCDLSVLVRIARIRNQSLQAKETEHHQYRRCNCGSGDD